MTARTIAIHATRRKHAPAALALCIVVALAAALATLRDFVPLIFPIALGAKLDLGHLRGIAVTAQGPDEERRLLDSGADLVFLPFTDAADRAADLLEHHPLTAPRLPRAAPGEGSEPAGEQPAGLAPAWQHPGAQT